MDHYTCFAEGIYNQKKKSNSTKAPKTLCFRNWLHELFSVIHMAKLWFNGWNYEYKAATLVYTDQRFCVFNTWSKSTFSHTFITRHLFPCLCMCVFVSVWRFKLGFVLLFVFCFFCNFLYKTWQKNMNHSWYGRYLDPITPLLTTLGVMKATDKDNCRDSMVWLYAAV